MEKTSPKVKKWYYIPIYHSSKCNIKNFLIRNNLVSGFQNVNKPKNDKGIYFAFLESSNVNCSEKIKQHLEEAEKRNAIIKGVFYMYFLEVMMN